MIGTLRRLVVGMSDSAGSAARWSMCGLIRIGEKGSRNGRHDACGRHLCLSQKIVIKRGHALDGMMGSRWDGASDAYRLVDAPASFFTCVLCVLCVQ
jgi:hypothetical protein